jgi:hypothetical protein
MCTRESGKGLYTPNSLKLLHSTAPGVNLVVKRDTRNCRNETVKEKEVMKSSISMDSHLQTISALTYVFFINTLYKMSLFLKIYLIV